MTSAAIVKWISSVTISLAVFAANVPTSAQTSADEILLKDYRPKSVYKVPESRVLKARYPIVDMHSHAYADSAEEIDRWVRTMDDVGIQKTMILTAAVGRKFDDITTQFRKHPERFDLWCGFDFTGYDKPGYGPAAVAELERCHKAGAVGVGEMGDKGKGLVYGEPKALGMHIDDPRMDPLLEKCAELGMPVSIHVAEPIWMYGVMDTSNDGLMNAYEWRLDNQPNIVGHQGMIDALERAVKKHARTKFIACHFANCCYDLAILGRLLDRYPNLYADIGARYAETATIPRYTARFFEKYQDRLLYGTDMGYDAEMYRTTFRLLETEDEHFYAFDLFTYHWPLYGMGLTDVVLKKIYRDNARKIMDGATIPANSPTRPKNAQTATAG